jgi:hypothetical protein
VKRNKKDFPTSSETREVLNRKEENIAKSYGCEPAYIFNIKNGHEPDPFPIFRAWFKDCAFGGGNVRVYLHDLEGIAYQAENGINPTGNLTEKLLSKIDTDAKSTHVLAQSIVDNYLDERECEQILKVCDRMKGEEISLRQLALNRLNELRSEK